MRTDTQKAYSERSFERSLVSGMMQRAGSPRLTVRLWNGEEFAVTDEPPVGCLEFRDRRVLPALMRKRSVGFGECYSDGLIEVQGDFLACMNEIARAIAERQDGRYYGPKFRSRLHALRANTLSRSRQNVHHHYDLGNDFYRLWLDERMVYTCAYYPTADATLDEAQVAKLDHVCRKLRLEPGQTVVEAGCGWGSLALHMAEHYGVRVLAFNNSHEQVAYARARAQEAGLAERVTFVEDDYRSITERCDVFVSVGMLEHVGLANYRALGELIGRVLKPDGIGLVHSIGRSHPQIMDRWIVKHIFPGGHVPSLSEMMRVFEPQRFSVLDVENLRPHYARTCADWLANFELAKDEIRDMYDEKFVRMWRLYLAGSSAGFNSGSLQLYQVLFAPRGSSRIPMTRDYQYADRH